MSMGRAWLRRVLRWCWRALLVIVAAAFLYGLAAIVLAKIRVNGDWRPPEAGIEVFVYSNGIHADFVLPARNAERDWLEFLRRETAASDAPRWVSFGWGDRLLYLETPAWRDLRITTALNAIFVPSPTLLHVDYWPWPPFEDERGKRLLLRPEEYRRLCAYVERGFRQDTAGRPSKVPDASYHETDEFYEACGSYHLIQTCNEWTNAGLKAAGIRAAVWTPFAWQVLDALSDGEW